VKAIITGASGFIGSALVKNLYDHGYDVTVVLRSKDSNHDRLPRGVKIVYEDIRNLHQLISLELGTFDVFYHLAWMGVSGDGRFDTSLQLLNIQSTLDAVEVAQKLGCKRFVGAGSIMEDESLFLSETVGKPMPMPYLYGAAKLSAHLLSKTKADDLRIEHVWAKITNAYGPGENSPRFINSTLRKIAKHEKLEFTAGTQNYDFIYIDDVAEAFRCMGEKGKNNSTYVIGSGKAQALRSYVESLHKSTGADQTLVFGDIPYRGVNLDLSRFDTNNLYEETGFVPKISFEEGIKRTYAWIKGEYDAKI
jgi:nucleoside-diphosphate-sugar epimerase